MQTRTRPAATDKSDRLSLKSQAQPQPQTQRTALAPRAATLACVEERRDAFFCLWQVFGRRVLSAKGRYVALNSLRAAAEVPKAGKLGGVKESEEGVDAPGMFEKQLLSAKSGVLNLGPRTRMTTHARMLTRSPRANTLADAL